jgi:hypothetical protein
MKFSITQKRYFCVFLYFLSAYSIVLLSQFQNKNQLMSIGFLRKKIDEKKKIIKLIHLNTNSIFDIFISK